MGLLDRLFEAKRGDTGETWTEQKRKVSAYDLTLAPHKSVTLAAEFAATISPLVTSGQFVWDETIVDGVENSLEAFRGIMRGENTGKMLVRI